MSTMPEIEAYQGMRCDANLQIVNRDGTSATSVFTSGSVLSASVWEGQNQAAIFAPTVGWYTKGSTQTGYDQGQVALSITGASTTALNPSGEYYLLITATTSAVASPVWEGRLKILATPGTTTPSPPDLATYDYVFDALSSLALTDAQRDFIPYLITAASALIRRWCSGRNFDLRTYTESYDVALNGQVRLFQPPVQEVLRVQGSPSLALTIANNSPSIQYAQAAFAYTGEFGGYGTSAQTVTGIKLSWVSSGTAASQTVSYSAGMTISTLAGLITAVGNGFSGQADSTYGAWPVTELDGGYVGQGCALGAVPGTGAMFNVLLDLTGCRLDTTRQGFLWVGRQYGNSLAGRWGPGGYDLFSDWDTNVQVGRVKVTYTAGESIIPAPIQVAVAELCKAEITQLKTEEILKSETADNYSYDLNDMAFLALPRQVQQRVSTYRLHYA